MDFVLSMPLKKGISFIQYAQDEYVRELKFKMSPFLSQEEKGSIYFDDDKTKEEIMERVESIIGNI